MYHSVLIPFSDCPTRWHPTESTGPFKVLSRGAFATREDAHAWAGNNLANQPYEVKEYPTDTDVLCPARIESFALCCRAGFFGWEPPVQATDLD